jgi:hypothetical protein
MSIDFDDMMSADDIERRNPRAVEVFGFVCAEKAPHGNCLIPETQCYLETKDLPFVIFEEESEDGSATAFANAAEFQQAMDWIRPPTEAEAQAWISDRLNVTFEKWRDRISATYLMTGQRR